MADKILHKRSLTLGSVPTTSSLEIGELAINVNDGKLFLRQSGSVDQIVNIGESASFAATASYVQTAQTASYVVTAQTASYVLNAVSSSFATTASFAASASWAPVSNPFPFTGSALITGSLGVTGSLTATQIGAGAAPSGSVRLDVRASSSAATDVVFRVRNSADTVNLLQQNGVGSILARSNDTFSYAGLFYRSDSANGWSLTNSHLGYGQGTGIETVNAVSYILSGGVRALSINTVAGGTYKSYGIFNWGSANGPRLTIGENTSDPQLSLSGTGNLGLGTYTAGARLDVRAQGALSTDIAFRVRNSADTANLIKIQGNGSFTLGNDISYSISFNPSSPSLKGFFSDATTQFWRLSNWTGEDSFIQTKLGVGISAPLEKLHVYSVTNDTSIKIGTGASLVANESACLKFATTNAGTSFGGDALIIRARSKGTTSGDQKCSAEFSLNRNGTNALRASITSQSNLLLQSPTENTNDVGVIYIPNGTAPTDSITDGFKQYSADIVAGNAAPHFRTENGSIVKLYQETTGVTAATLVSNAGTTLTSTDTFDGYTMQQVVKALRNLGILA
jgi:hypothetical protein